MQSIVLRSDRQPPPISTKDLVRFTPDSLKDREDAPVFLIKIPTVREKIAFESAMEMEGLRYPQDVALYAVLREAIADQVIESEQPGLVQIIEEAEAAAEEGNPLSDDLTQHLEEINQALRPFYPPLGKLFAERRRYLGMVWLLRAQMFLMGVEGKDVPVIERKAGQVTEASIEAIENKYGNGTIVQIGVRTMPMTTPDDEQKKASELLEPSPADPETSMEAQPLPTARRGKSLANGSNAIPGSI